VWSASATCRDLYQKLTRDASAYWEFTLRRYPIDTLQVASIGPNHGPRLEELLTAKRVLWSARWSFALMMLTQDAAMAFLTSGAAGPTSGASADVWAFSAHRARKRHIARVESLNRQHPHDDDRIWALAWLELFETAHHPLVKMWARIKANYHAGNGNLALDLAGEFPYDAVPARVASALGVPTSEEAQAAFCRELSARSYDTRPEEEVDVTQSSTHALQDQRKLRMQRRLEAAKKELERLPPPRDPAFAKLSATMVHSLLGACKPIIAFTREGQALHNHVLVGHIEPLPKPTTDMEKACCQRYGCMPSVAKDYGPVSMTGSLPGDAEVRLRNAQFRALMHLHRVASNVPAVLHAVFPNGQQGSA
jgi:hypothetical protein